MQSYPPGTRIGQYEIASRPMMGGMGVVYLALDQGNDGRPVALKTFRPELLPDRAARDRFLREGTAWIELGSHPHIVRCYKVEYIDPTAFLVLELIAKEQNMPDASLRSWLIPGRPLPLEQALLFALQIARGMQHATEKIPGFVHRDLKPENILVGVDRLPGTDINRLRVTDFGLVKTISDSSVQPTLSGAKEIKPTQIQFTRGIGTPLYMAPEQWKGEPVGVFTDIYAFGCILYEILSGQHAADGKTISELEMNHCRGTLQPIPSNLSKDMMALVTKCLALDITHRYVTWAEIVGDLESIYVIHPEHPSEKIIEFLDADVEESEQIGWSYNAMGIAFRDMGKSKIARDYFEKALRIAREMGNIRGEEVALSNLGLAYSNLGDARQAIRHYEEALEICRNIKDRQAEAVILSNLGGAYLALGDVQRAIGFQEQALAIARGIRDRHGEGSATNNLGNAYRNLGNARQAIKYYEEYLIISREAGDRRGMGKALGNLGQAYADLGDLRSAIEYYELRLAIAREIGDQSGESITINNLANAYADIGEMKRAIETYEQCLYLYRETGNRFGEGTVLSNLGTVYLQIENVKQAMECYEHAIVIQRETGDTNGIATSMFNMAGVYAKQGNINRALPLAQEAAQIFAQIGSPNVQTAQRLIAQLRSGNASLQAETVQAAFETFQRADGIATMQLAVSQYPFMADIRFFQIVEQAIKEQVPPDLRPTFEQRLAWLKQIAGK